MLLVKSSHRSSFAQTLQSCHSHIPPAPAIDGLSYSSVIGAVIANEMTGANSSSRLEAASRHFESILMGASQYLDNNDDVVPENPGYSSDNNITTSPRYQRQHRQNHNQSHASSYNPTPAMRERENLLISSQIGVGWSNRDRDEGNSFTRTKTPEDTVHSSTSSLWKVVSSQASQPLSSSSTTPAVRADQDHYKNFTSRLNKIQTTTSRIENAHIDNEIEPMGPEEREDLIVTLQGEVTRLKAKLTSIITSAESTITDAQFAQDDMQAHYAAECELLTEKNLVLQEENAKLRAMLKESNDNLAVERDLLLRSVKYMERLRLRGKSLNKNLDRKTLVRDLKEYREKEHREATLKRSSSFQSRVW